MISYAHHDYTGSLSYSLSKVLGNISIIKQIYMQLVPYFLHGQMAIASGNPNRPYNFRLLLCNFSMFALFGRTFVFQIAINSKQNSLIMKNFRIFRFFFYQHWLIAPFKWKPVRKFVEFITIIHLRREIYIIKGNKCWFGLINVYSLFHFRLASTWAVGCTFRQEASVYVIKCCYYVTEIATM